MVSTGSSTRRILYLQYTNPGAYPPLEHSSRILADDGWQVRFVGIRATGLDAMTFPAHPGIEVRLLPGCEPGWRQKLHYLRFLARSVWEVISWRPDWLYASDPLSAPAAWLARRVSGVKLLYHEHDSPSSTPGSPVMRLALAARRAVGAEADLRVLPNEQRARQFAAVLGEDREIHTVWNCPRLDEVAPERPAPSGPLQVLYHGTIVPERLPKAVIGALAQLDGRAHLLVIGYETLGSRGYVDELRAEAARLGVEGQVRFRAAMPRHDLLREARSCDVGLCFMPPTSDDLNMREMVGASNKAFDYLASGLGLLVTDLPEWREFFVERELALACDPRDAGSIAAALRWYVENPEALRRMGERGRQQVLSGWNYQAQFSGLLARIEEGAGEGVRRAPGRGAS